MPRDPGEQNALKACLTDDFGDRADRLEGVEVVSAGAFTIEPRMRVVTREKPQIEESDIYPWMSGDPAADAFNRYVAKTLALDKRRMDDRDLFPFGDDVDDMKLFAHRTYSLARFDARIASLQIQTFDYTGGAHEAINESSLNWDVARAKPFGLDDVFAKDTPWRKFATDFCIKALHGDFEGQGAPDPDREAVERVVGDGDNWLWGRRRGDRSLHGLHDRELFGRRVGRARSVRRARAVSARGFTGERRCREAVTGARPREPDPANDSSHRPHACSAALSSALAVAQCPFSPPFPY